MKVTFAIIAAAIAALGSFGCGGQVDGEPADHCARTNAADGHATDLACTGLYSDFATGAIAADVDAYEPSIALWSDGAEKRRFIRLPPGSAIDTSDMDHWVFPVGTKLWKEFSMGGRRVETRHLEKRADGTWLRTTYAWSADKTQATELLAGAENAGRTGLDIPAQSECATCHEGAPDGVLGFEAIGLSGPQATGLTMSRLVARGLVTEAPAAPLAIPGNATEAAALGWLHANCGNACHNRTPAAYAEATGMFLRLTVGDLGSVKDTDTFATAVGVRSGFQPTPGAGFLRIAPGDVAHSAIPYRDLSRDIAGRTGVQMPPLATRVPDVAGVALVQAWIAGMPPAPTTAPTVQTTPTTQETPATP